MPIRLRVLLKTNGYDADNPCFVVDDGTLDVKGQAGVIDWITIVVRCICPDGETADAYGQ